MQPLLDRLRARIEPAGLAPAEALALLVLLTGAAALTAAVWWGTQPVVRDALPPPTPQATDGATTGPGRPLGAPTAPADHVQPADLVVHVAGQVASPGLVTVPSGARVADALQAAGGLTAQAATDALNLARPVVDGEQILVPAIGEALPPPAVGGGPSATDIPLDLNTATTEELQQLPGVGPVMAQRILDHRTAIGRFADVTQLLEVPGIGPARFADLEPRVRV